MSAIGGPDEHSHITHAEGSKEYNSADLSYEPEREFVLMPLFRRIGELLGLRRSQESEYLYEPEANAPREQVVLPETAIQYSEPQLPAENQAPVDPPETFERRYPEASIQGSIAEDVLQPESEPQPSLGPVLQESASDLHEIPVEPIHIEQQQQWTDAPPISDEARHEPLVAAHSGEAEMGFTESVPEEWPAPALPTAAVSPSPKHSPEEVRQLVAPLREAAARITAIVAQAAEWLRAKEEEFLRSADVASGASRPQQELSTASQLRSAAEDSATADVVQQNEAPAFQAEYAEPAALEHELRPVPIQFVAKPDRPLTALKVPFWKRVNWAEEFTPKRVAVLGGLAMAVLIVIGISFARRPASSVLPEQQQTRSREPGGVTVTTHPMAPVPPPVLRKTAATDRPSPVVQQRRPAGAAGDAYDDEPEVIIHHYDTARKPSPVKQTTVAGVRHYSDM